MVYSKVWSVNLLSAPALALARFSRLSMNLGLDSLSALAVRFSEFMTRPIMKKYCSEFCLRRTSRKSRWHGLDSLIYGDANRKLFLRTFRVGCAAWTDRVGG